MKNLPPEILKIICEYADVKCRNGRYMTQISATDPRRAILKTIPQKDIRGSKNIDGDMCYCVFVRKKNVRHRFSIDYFETSKNNEDNTNYYHYTFISNGGLYSYNINTNREVSSSYWI